MIFSCMRGLGSFFGFKIFNFVKKIGVGGVQKNDYFWGGGMKILWIFFFLGGGGVVITNLDYI